jgi:hypothetical protein
MALELKLHVLIAHRSFSCVFPLQSTTMVFTAASRQAFRCVAKQQCRSFSATPSVGAGSEVKKLGVIGAGQMV